MRNILSGLLGSRDEEEQPTIRPVQRDAADSGGLLHDLGGGVLLYEDAFVLGNITYGRRQPPLSLSLERSAETSYSEIPSQFDGWDGARSFAGAVPQEHEVFRHCTASMRATLRQMAHVMRSDSAPATQSASATKSASSTKSSNPSILLTGPTGCGKTTWQRPSATWQMNRVLRLRSAAIPRSAISTSRWRLSPRPAARRTVRQRCSVRPWMLCSPVRSCCSTK